MNQVDHLSCQEKKILLEKYAHLTVKVGANVQKNQLVVIRSSVNCFEFVRELVKASYEVGARKVIVEWSDEYVQKEHYMHASDETVKEVPEYVVNKHHYFVQEKACLISISSPTPGLMKDVDPTKVQMAQVASQEKIGFFRNFTMNNETQWVVVAYPTKEWAMKVFPNESEEVAFNHLLVAILEASRVRIDNDPVKEWMIHMDQLAKHNQILNQYHFAKLHFKNQFGTDLEVQLVDEHIWGGGGEYSQDHVYFAPNIPTEETFTMPHSQGVNGKVVATKPLNYQGKLIEDFYLVFKDGKVIDFDAKKEKETLKSLLNTDEGSSRLGEVALISHQSPISNMNILFYNTLFDENASSHLALGNAYTMNIQNGNQLSIDELKKKGYNKSMVHVDFMFGSADMNIQGITKEGKEITIFENGNFVF